MITMVADGVTRLADNSFGDDLGDGVAGPVGLLIIVLLAVATVFLIRNMNNRLKRLPEAFPDPSDSPVQHVGSGGDSAPMTTDSTLVAGTDATPASPTS